MYYKSVGWFLYDIKICQKTKFERHSKDFYLFVRVHVVLSRFFVFYFKISLQFLIFTHLRSIFVLMRISLLMIYVDISFRKNSHLHLLNIYLVLLFFWRYILAKQYVWVKQYFVNAPILCNFSVKLMRLREKLFFVVKIKCRKTSSIFKSASI